MNQRIIKFRAWDEINKEMYSVGMLEWDVAENLATPIKYIMQYTGLKSKSGIEIYEGDILIDNNDWTDDKPTFREQGDILVVEWVEYYASFMFKNKSRGSVNDILMSANGELEIIGNIWENPELLE